MKKGKKLLVALLSVMMVLCMMPAMAFAEGGTGTAADPYVVTSESELETAFANGGYIKVGGDIELTKPQTVAKEQTVTLDLAGHTISQTLSENPGKNYAMLTNRGTLTIDDSSKGGKISFTYAGTSSNWSFSTSTISNECATLTVDGGTVENATNVSNHIYFAIDNLTNSNIGDATLTINGGTVSCPNYRAIRQFANGDVCPNTLNITGGTISSKYVSIWVQSPNTKNNKSVLNVSGGTIGRIYVEQEDSDAFTVSVTGGTFTGEGTKTQTEGCAGASNKDIIIEATANNVAVVKNFISGGVFSDTPAIDNLAAEMSIVKNDTTGDYYVGNSETLNNALSTVESGTELTVLYGSVNLTLENAGVTVTKGSDAGEVIVNDANVDVSFTTPVVHEHEIIEFTPKDWLAGMEADGKSICETPILKKNIWYCDGCKEYFADEAGTELLDFDDEATYFEYFDAPAGHQFEDGVCTVCGAEDPNYNPGENGEPTTPPTDNPPAGGTTDDAKDKDVSKDKAQADKDTPKTGDATSAMPFVLLVTSLAAAGSLIALRKREE